MLAVSVLKVCFTISLLFSDIQRLRLTNCLIVTDNILITENGYENLTTTVKEVDDMCGLVNGS